MLFPDSSGWAFSENPARNLTSNFAGLCWLFRVEQVFYPRRDKDKRSNISTSQLNTLLCLHLWPINLVVFQESQRKPYLGMSLALRCFQRLSLPYIATQRCRCHDNCHTRSTSFQVLSYYEMNPSSFLRPRWIRTELSHDVLNPARVPL